MRQQRSETEMAASKPIQSVANPFIWQEDVFQTSSWHVLRDAGIEVNPTPAQELFLQTGLLFGAGGRTAYSTFAPDLVDVDPLPLSPQASATLVAGSISVWSAYPEFRCKVHSQLKDFDGLDSSACPTCLECLTWCDAVKK